MISIHATNVSVNIGFLTKLFKWSLKKKYNEKKSPIITLIDIQCTKEFCSVSAQFQLRTEIKTVNNNNIHLELLTAHL